MNNVMKIDSVDWTERGASLCFRLRYSAVARSVLILTVLAAVAAVLFARPAQLTDLSVRPLVIDAAGADAAGDYVRVSGMFRPDETMKRYLRLEQILGRGYGPEFAAIVDPNSGAVLWVREDRTLTREANAPLTLIGRVTIGYGEEPPFYILVGRPLLVRAAEWIVRLGVVLIIVGIGMVALLWFAERMQFALPSLWRSSDAVAESTRLLFYGGLGYSYDDVQLRAAPVRLDAGVYEVRITGTSEPLKWSIVVRRVLEIDVYDVASTEGPLAGFWIRFEDDRGLLRTVVLAAPSRRARAVLIEVLSNLRQ